MIPEFKNMNELLEFAKVNGYGEKGKAKLIEEWEASKKEVYLLVDKEEFDSEDEY
jgi:hypothetical protein